MSNRRWPALIVAIALCLLRSAASAQRSGTALRNTVTFQSPDTGAVEFNVTDKQVGDRTVLTLEFGGEGQDSTGPGPGPLLPKIVKFTVSMKVDGATTTLQPFFASADQDQTQSFGTKKVELRRLDRMNAPDLYELSVTHNARVPSDTTETWKLEITGLPQRLRGVGFLRSDTFKSVSPVGACPRHLSGTVLRQTMTFAGAGAPTMQINVARGTGGQTLTT